MSEDKCLHQFVASSEKGEWRVKVLSTNNRGTPEDEIVDTTVFVCKKCGRKKEYPDFWEKNYVAPGRENRKRNAGRKAKARAGKKKRQTDCA